MLQRLVVAAALVCVCAGSISSSAVAADRIAVENTRGELMMKEGPLYATWQKLNSGVTMGDFQLTNTWVTILDNTPGLSGAPVADVSIKEPHWDSFWNIVYGGEGFDAKQIATAPMTTPSWGNRLFVLSTSGKLLMKEPVWNTGWWSGSIEPSGEVVKQMWASGNNILVLTESGKLLGKDLTPGAYGHPMDVSWSVVANNVQDASASFNRIAYVSTTGNVYAKEGKLNAPWHSSVIYAGMLKVKVADDKICGLSSSKGIYCKQGALNAMVAYTYDSNADDIQLTRNRFVVHTKDSSVYAMEGNLIGNSQGWMMVNYGDALRVRAQ